MQRSKYTLISQMRDSQNWFIMNPLTKEADILEPAIAKAYLDGTLEDEQPFIDKGYLIDAEAEEKLYKEAYLNFIDNRDADEIQIFFVPWYSCNFNCFYCYQDEYDAPKAPLDEEVIDAFFEYVNKSFAGKRKYITYFGGEPLLLSGVAKARTIYFFDKAKEHNIDLSIVTNGYTLTEWVDTLKEYSIREVQVTVDGMASEHDARRPIKADPSRSSFNKIIDGIDAAIKANITVNMRMVVDKENILDLPKMADLAIEKGWTKSVYFKTQLGRNYELHHCQSEQTKLFTRVTMYESLYEMVQKYPQVLEFHKPAFSISKFLSENGQMPDPLFDACPAAKNEWAFDYTGNIYTCTATVGKKGEELGTYWPRVTHDQETIDEWEERDVTTIEKCTSCSQALFCGGGCGSISKNNHNGKIQTPDCRPITELLELGLSLYVEKGVK